MSSGILGTKVFEATKEILYQALYGELVLGTGILSQGRESPPLCRRPSACPGQATIVHRFHAASCLHHQHPWLSSKTWHT